MEYRAVVGFEGLYEVSNLGEVRRVAAARGATVGRTLRWIPSRAEYPRVALSRAGRSTRPFVHRLVAAAFLGPCPVGSEVNHKNRNRRDPSASNLEYVTRSENNLHAYRSGVIAPRGEDKRGHRLSWDQVRAIRDSNETHRALGERYGVSHGTIGRIRSGEDWRPR